MGATKFGSKLHLFVVATLSALSVLQAEKNVLMIAVDDLRTEFSAYGEHSTHTPALDALAAKSMVFERAYCQVALCSPSRTSLLTGRRPDTNHVWRISPNEYWRYFTNATTIPQYFKENGYRSIGMGKVFHGGLASGLDDRKYSWSLPYFHGKDSVTSPNSWHCFDNTLDSELMDGQIADHAVNTLSEIKLNRTHGDDTPFFMAVGFHKPHLPFFMPSKYCDLYPPADKIPLARNTEVPKNAPPIAMDVCWYIRSFNDTLKYNSSECYTNADALMFGDKCRISDDDARALRRAYYAAISFTDAQIGRVLTQLVSQGFDNDTIVVLWGDHGWKLGEHNLWCKFDNYEDGTHVPFLLRVPGITDKGLRSSALVELIDIFPSLTELTGLKMPPLCPMGGSNDPLACVEGNSVAPLLKNPNQDWKRAAFSQFARPLSGLTSIPGKPPFQPYNDEEDVMGYAVRVDQYRFIEWYKFNRNAGTPDFSQVWGTELYNHTSPTSFFDDENENLASDPAMSHKVGELRTILQAGWRKSMPPKDNP